jgi:iron complex transport system substrate-binding protein
VRIVSLLPAATEIVSALGALDELVGVTHECDEPAAVASLPRLTRPRTPTAAGASSGAGAAPISASRAIDESVRATAASGLSIFDLDAARLAALAPDVVITQDLCDVCAVALDDVRAALRALVKRDVELVSLSPMRLADVLGDVRRVAAAIGREPQAERLLAALHERIVAVRRRAANAWHRPRTVTVEWLDPVMLGGTWMPELVELAGGEPIGAVAGAKAPSPDRATLESLDAEAVLLKPCGFSLELALAELPVALRTLPSRTWPAFALGRVCVADGSQYFNRPGPRIVDSLELLAAALHPQLFPDFLRRFARAARRLGSDGSPLPFDATALTSAS